MSPTEQKIPGLLSDVAESIADVVRNEVRLARAELGKAGSDAMAGLGMIAAALALAVPALTVLAFAVVAALTEAGVAPWLASLGVAISMAIVAFLLFSAGKKTVISDHAKLAATTRNIKSDINALKESAT